MLSTVQIPLGNCQVIPVLGAQRLMGPKLVCFLNEKFLSLLRPTIILCRKRLIILVRSVTGNPNREIGEELWRNIFKNFTQKPPGKNIQSAPRTQDRKNKKNLFNSHENVKNAKWLPGWDRSLNRPANSTN